MISTADRLKLQEVLSQTVSLLCCNSLSDRIVFRIDALIGITLDSGEVVLININELMNSNSENSNWMQQKLVHTSDSNYNARTAQQKENHDQIGFHPSSNNVRHGLTLQQKQSEYRVNIDGMKEEMTGSSELSDCEIVMVEDGGGADDIKNVASNLKCTNNIQEQAAYEVVKCEQLQLQCYNEESDATDSVSVRDTLTVHVNPDRSTSFGISKRFGRGKMLGQHTGFRHTLGFKRRLPLSTSTSIRHRVPQTSMKNFKTENTSSVATDHGTADSAASLSLIRPTYQCTVCGGYYYDRSTLRTHIDGQHLHKKLARCGDCGESFTWRSQLSKHRRLGWCPVIGMPGDGSQPN